MLGKLERLQLLVDYKEGCYLLLYCFSTARDILGWMLVKAEKESSVPAAWLMLGACLHSQQPGLPPPVWLSHLPELPVPYLAQLSYLVLPGASVAHCRGLAQLLTKCSGTKVCNERPWKALKTDSHLILALLPISLSLHLSNSLSMHIIETSPT